MIPEISPSAAEECTSSLTLLFSSRPIATRDNEVASVLEAIKRGDIDPAGLIVARDGDGVTGVILAAHLPGNGAVIWPPQVARGVIGSDAVADALVRHARGWLQRRGAKLIQAILLPDEAPTARPLLRNGFIHATQLWYLRHNLDFAVDILGRVDCLRLETFRACDADLFGVTLARSYEWTQDFPELTGVRTSAEVMAGYQADGFDPDRWWLAFGGKEPVGVLLVNPAPDWGGWDVSYVGVVPEARRRGVGRELMRHALIEAKAAGMPHLSVAVDVRNLPASELYRRLGFESFDQRDVYLCILR